MRFLQGDVIRERTDVQRLGIDASPIALVYRVESSYLMAIREDGSERPSALYDLDDATTDRFELVTKEMQCDG